MAAIKISDLTSVTTLTDSDVLPIVNGNDTKKVSVSQLSEYLGGGGSSAYVIIENGSSSSSYNINTATNRSTVQQVFNDISDGKAPIVFLLSTHGTRVAASTPSCLYPLQVMKDESKLYAIIHPNFSSTSVGYGVNYNAMYTIQIGVSGTITDDGYSVTSLSMSMQSNWLYVGDSIPQSRLPLGVGNTSAYTPSGNYNPATKKYVDDSISNKIWVGTQAQYDALSSHSDSTLYFIKETS